MNKDDMEEAWYWVKPALIIWIVLVPIWLTTECQKTQEALKKPGIHAIHQKHWDSTDGPDDPDDYYGPSDRQCIRVALGWDCL